MPLNYSRNPLKFASSKKAKATGGIVFIGFAVALVTGFLALEARSNRLKKLTQEHVYTMQPGDIPTNNIVFGIQIMGSNGFPLQIARSLFLLKLGDPKTFTRVTNSIGIVREGIQSGVWHTNKPPLVEISTEQAFISLTWCAAVFAHEARHVELVRKRRSTNGFTISYGSQPSKTRYKQLQGDELECNSLQLEVLKKLGAPRIEVEFVRTQDGTHFDVNRDGKWDMEDVRLKKLQRQ